MKTIFLANTAEAFMTLLEKGARSKQGLHRIRHELTLSQRAFFWGGDGKCVITPYPIPQALFRHNAEVCGYRNVENVSPRKPSVALSKSLRRDSSLWRRVFMRTEANTPTVLSPYAFTNNFMSLARMLQRRNSQIEVEGMPVKHSFWTVNYLDSKIGFRMEMQQMTAECEFLRVPEGFVAGSIREATDIVAWQWSNGRSSVVKVNLGESGWGLWFCHADKYRSEELVRAAFREVLDSDSVWESLPFIIEELIEAGPAGSPSVEFFVGEDGPAVTYHCNQVVDAAGAFSGVQIGKDAVAPGLKSAMERVAMAVGTRYHSLGYRGFCDIDFVVGKDHNLYVVETNPRRTGGTHVYDLAKHLFGETWEEEVYLLSSDEFWYGDRHLSAQGLLERIRELLYPIMHERRGIIVTSLNPWEPVMGYVAIGRDLKEGRELQQNLLNLFG